ncbi:hypothetical protein KC19_VG334700 [Ceratodon purpureus]|uniref:Secreted protein n=1 Tax=Ceratodon purpureus TaxID=3225 RepID=A0A8T0HW09_CERPU|nr:hypothetical protein KC19_VG334700 [Ceratodon purpureus]
MGLCGPLIYIRILPMGLCAPLSALAAAICDCTDGQNITQFMLICQRRSICVCCPSKLHLLHPMLGTNPARSRLATSNSACPNPPSLQQSSPCFQDCKTALQQLLQRVISSNLHSQTSMTIPIKDGVFSSTTITASTFRGAKT